jgi:hypothetical protein
VQGVKLRAIAGLLARCAALAHDVATGDGGRAAARLDCAGQDLERRGLACAVDTQVAKTLASRDGQRLRMQRDLAAAGSAIEAAAAAAQTATALGFSRNVDLAQPAH